eukprot:10709730-Alexandrium_andersonii.AAC.1
MAALGLRLSARLSWVSRAAVLRLGARARLGRKRPCFQVAPLLEGRRFQLRPKPRRRATVGLVWPLPGSRRSLPNDERSCSS